MRPSCQGVVTFIVNNYCRCAEIGVGRFPDVALALGRQGVQVFATDVRPYQHRGLDVILDDVMQPDLSLYAGVQAIYSVRPPLELIPYMERLAKAVTADLIVKPLASECPPAGRLTGSGNAAFFLWGNR
jgi:uncharacterized UPF0146 family protein